MPARMRALTVTDQGDWQAVLPTNASVFGGIEYARIRQEHTGHAARLLVYESPACTVVYPFFIRPVDALPFFSGIPGTRWDTLTPEFTGPLLRTGDERGAGRGFADSLAAYCKEHGIVTEFGHLHPWSHSTPSEHSGLLEESCVHLDREIVYIDLTLTDEQLWKDSFTKACRKNIRRAERENVRIFPAQTPGDVREFYRIHSQTMDRVEAADQYCFDLNYFGAFWELMPGNARFVLAEHKGQIVAATLYLHDDTEVYSYLGGTDQAFQRVRPTNAMIYETIRWARRQGKKRLVLGGGYRPDDGIFRFKASFSPLRARFYVYKRIHLPDDYAALCDAWSAHYDREIDPDGYFPPYRSIPIALENNA